MKNIRDSCIEFLQNEDIRKDVKEIIKPLVQIVYNEVYIYIWLICFYNVVLIFISLATLIIIIRKDTFRPTMFMDSQNPV
jgi:hypothetical protein